MTQHIHSGGGEKITHWNCKIIWTAKSSLGYLCMSYLCWKRQCYTPIDIQHQYTKCEHSAGDDVTHKYTPISSYHSRSACAKCNQQTHTFTHKTHLFWATRLMAAKPGQRQRWCLHIDIRHITYNSSYSCVEMRLTYIYPHRPRYESHESLENATPPTIHPHIWPYLAYLIADARNPHHHLVLDLVVAHHLGGTLPPVVRDVHALSGHQQHVHHRLEARTDQFRFAELAHQPTPDRNAQRRQILFVETHHVLRVRIHVHRDARTAGVLIQFDAAAVAAVARRTRTGRLQLRNNSRVPFPIDAHQRTDARADDRSFGQAFSGRRADFLLGLGAELGRVQAELFVAEHGRGIAGVGVLRKDRFVEVRRATGSMMLGDDDGRHLGEWSLGVRLIMWGARNGHTD